MSCSWWETKSYNGFFSKYIFFLKKNKTVSSGEMTTNRRKRYFNIDENISSKQLYALLGNVESDDEDDIDKSINDSDTEFIAEEEISVRR